MKVEEIIVKKLVCDITDRSGLGDEWDQIDKGTQKTIEHEWHKIIRNALLSEHDTLTKMLSMKQDDWLEVCKENDRLTQQLASQSLTIAGLEGRIEGYRQRIKELEGKLELEKDCHQAYKTGQESANNRIKELEGKLKPIEEVHSLVEPMAPDIPNNQHYIERILWNAIKQAMEGKDEDKYARCGREE